MGLKLNCREMLSVDDISSSYYTNIDCSKNYFSEVILRLYTYSISEIVL